MPISRALSLSVAAFPLVLSACSAPAEHADAPARPTATAPTVSVPEPGPETASSSEPETDASAQPAPPPPPAPETPTYTDLVDSPGDTRLTEAAELLKANEASRARKALAKVVPEIDASGTLDAKMAAHALLGRACQSLGDEKCAAAHFKTVRELWKDPEQGVKSIAEAGGDDAAKLKRTLRALKAVGEALFYAAEEKRLAAEKEKMPEYTGTGSRDSVLKHIRTKVAAWAKSRRQHIEEAEKAYAQILSIQPAPPPKWVVHAGAKVGTMWGKFAAEFRAAPVPKEWKQSGPVPGSPGMTWEDLRKAYYEAVDEAAEPIKSRARSAFQSCQDMSKKYAYTDALSKTCDAWLSKNPPAPATTTP